MAFAIDKESEIHLSDLQLKHFPLKVCKYNTDEGCDRYAILTFLGLKICYERGSYGYDTGFNTKEDAEKTKKFLENIVK